ncbi:MAG: hypothetical protein ACYS30_18160 [Planctomycetota bacterium]|jgi:hypothetical protein
MGFCGFLKQSTTTTLTLGPCLDDDDALTEKTGLTIADTTVFLAKNGGAKAVPNDTNDCTEDANGVYRKQIDTTDTDTLGRLTVYVHESDVLYLRQDYSVITANAWDTLFSTDKFDVNVAEVTAGIIANASFNSDVGSTAYATNIIALAARKVLDELNLDHLCKQATGAADMTTEVADNTILSRMLSNGDTSAFVPSTDGLQLIRDVAPHGTAMRGTDSAALASVVGALADAAAAGEVTSSDTVMQYIKQLINILIGTPGIGTFPSEAAPGNGVSLAEVLRAIHTDVTGINGASMYALDTTVATEDSTTSFTLTDGKASNDAYNGMFISITDAGDSNIEVRRIQDWTSAKVVTVERAFSFTPAASDVARILEASYGVMAQSAGANAITYTVRDGSSNLMEGVTVWISTDSAGLQVIWNGVTDSNGIAKEAVGDSKPYLDAGTYYFWRQKSGYNFSNPDTEVFS